MISTPNLSRSGYCIRINGPVMAFQSFAPQVTLSHVRLLTWYCHTRWSTRSGQWFIEPVWGCRRNSRFTVQRWTVRCLATFSLLTTAWCHVLLLERNTVLYFISTVDYEFAITRRIVKSRQNSFLWWHISAITCRIIMLTCQVITRYVDLSDDFVDLSDDFARFPYNNLKNLSS